MSQVAVLLMILGTVGGALGLSYSAFPVAINPLFASCSNSTRRAALLCPCLLLPSSNRGIPIPCGTKGTACLPFDSSLLNVGIRPIPGFGICQCTSGFTRNSTSNTCSANLNVIVTPDSATVACNILAGQLAVFNITISGGVGPYTVKPLTVFSSGDFPGVAQFAPLYLDLDPSNRLRVVPQRASPDLDITQCYTLTVTDSVNAVASTIFCALIQTPNICPRTNVGVTAVLTTSAVVPITQPQDQPIGRLTGYGGLPPFTFDTSPTIVSCVGEVDAGGDPGGCNPYTVLAADGTISLNPTIKNLPVKDTVDCLTAVVKDATGAIGKASYCVTIKAP